MRKAKVFLNNGRVANIDLLFDNTQDWLDSVAIRGIATEDSHFPYHSIAYILFDVEGNEMDLSLDGTVKGEEN